MPRREIPRDRWREELDSFSRSHEGWIVRVAVTEPDGQSYTEAHDVPLQGVTADSDPTPAIAIMFGDQPDAHVTHEVRHPVQLAIELTERGATSALHVRARDGSMTTVEFRSPMRPEEVDGVAFRK